MKERGGRCLWQCLHSFCYKQPGCLVVQEVLVKTTNSLGIEMTSSSGNLVSQRHLVDSAEHCWESKVNVRRLQGEILQYSSSHIVLILEKKGPHWFVHVWIHKLTGSLLMTFKLIDVVSLATLNFIITFYKLNFTVAFLQGPLSSMSISNPSCSLFDSKQTLLYWPNCS